MAVVRMGPRAVAAVVASVFLGGAAVPAAAASGGAGGALLAPATVGGPNAGYSSGAKVSLVSVSCSGGAPGAYVVIPSGLTAALDVATGVWDQPGSWVLAPARGVSAPAASAACYQVATLTLDGETFGVPQKGATSTMIYPSGSQRAPSAGTLPTLGAAGSSTASGSAPAQPTAGAGGAEAAAGPISCPAPSTPQRRRISQHVSVWVCAPPSSAAPGTTQAAQPDTSLPAIGVFAGTCLGGQNSGKLLPKALLGQGVSAAGEQIQWCQDGQ